MDPDRANIRWIVNIFGLNPRYLVEREDRAKWIRVLTDLSKEPPGRIMEEYEKVLDYAGPDKPRLYYLEAVRRRIEDQKHQDLKAATVPVAIKELFNPKYFHGSRTDNQRVSS